MATKEILAIRYTEATFRAALEAGDMDQIEQDFGHIKQIIKSYEKNKYLLLSSVVPQRIKGQFWESIIKNNKFSEITNNLIRSLNKNNRLEALPAIFRNYHKMLLEKKGVLIANVTTAVELDDKAIEKMAKDLKQSLGQEVKVETETRKDIIGGIIVRIGSRMIDYSVKTKLRNLKNTMQSARI